VRIMKSRSSRTDSRDDGNPTPRTAAQNDSFAVVAIGASAGGLEAFTEFFQALPIDTGMAFVLVQHLDPRHQSLLTEIIARVTRMPVEEVRAGSKIKPNRVYVIPPNTLMAIAQGVFTLTPRSKEPGQHLVIDFFMRSLAEERKSRAIGIVLSGTGADGTLGVTDIKAQGGITFAEDPALARYDSMPRSAIASECVDFVLSPKDIARELERVVRHPYVRQEKDEASMEPALPGKGNFGKILDLLRKVSRVDFSRYKPNTIHRRALRRMAILKLDSLTEYAKYLKDHSDEVEKLYDDILIPVTSFFRDPEAFEALKTPSLSCDCEGQGEPGHDQNVGAGLLDWGRDLLFGHDPARIPGRQSCQLSSSDLRNGPERKVHSKGAGRRVSGKHRRGGIAGAPAAFLREDRRRLPRE
jgi:two-component system, chemotaxis family, CheB/CheR fusion protein